MPEVIKTLEEFKAKVLVDTDKLMVVDFTAAWCGPCKIIAPKFEAMSKEFPTVGFFKVDVDENDDTAAEYGIQAMPTFLFFKGGKKLGVNVVGGNEAKLRQLISENK